MKILASLLVATALIAYVYLTQLLANLVPWYISPVIHILAVAIIIYFTTKDSLK